MIETGVSIQTKTYVTVGLVFLALFEFCTAMYLFGRKGRKAGAKWVLRLHRWGGYAFLLYWLWPMIVGLDLLGRLSRYDTGWTFDGPRFYHAFLGVVVFLLLLLKISFVRLYPQYRQQARPLGILITLGAITTWIIAGWFWLAMMASPQLKSETEVAPPGKVMPPPTRPSTSGETSLQPRRQRKGPRPIA